MAERSGWDGVFVWDHVAYREWVGLSPTRRLPWPRLLQPRSTFASASGMFAPRLYLCAALVGAKRPRGSLGASLWGGMESWW